MDLLLNKKKLVDISYIWSKKLDTYENFSKIINLDQIIKFWLKKKEASRLICQ